MSTKRCKVHYRRLHRKDDNFSRSTLSEALKASLRTAIDGKEVGKYWKHRLKQSDKVPGYQLLINDLAVGKDYVFGNLCLFAQGELQALLKLADEEGDAAHVDLAEVLANLEINESRAPDGHEYIHGISYWLAFGDHLYQIQHVSLQAAAMEEALTWLLREKTGIIKAEHEVVLESKFDVEAVGHDLGEITAVQIGGAVQGPPVVDSLSANSEELVEEHRSIGDKVRAGWGSAQKILEELLGHTGAQKLVEMVPNEADLEVTVQIGYRAKRRKFSKSFMDELATGLRNLPDGEVRIQGKKGSTIGSDARLSMDMTVKKVRATSGLLDLEDARSQMLEVHRRFTHDKKIKDN